MLSESFFGMSRHQNNLVSGSHSKHYPLVFLPTDCWQVLLASDTIAGKIFGNKGHVKVRSFIRSYGAFLYLFWFLSYFLLLWISIEDFFFGDIFMLVPVIPATVLVLFFILSFQFQIFTSCLAYFDVYFILTNIFLSAYLLSFKMADKSCYILLVPLYLLSYVTTVMCDALPVKLGPLDITFEQQKNINSINLKNLGFPIIEEDIRSIQACTLNFRSVFSQWRPGRVKAPFLRPSLMHGNSKQIFYVHAGMLAVVLGWGFQMYLYSLTQTQWTDSENVVIDMKWMKWTDNEILSYTSVNIVVFLTKKLYFLIVDPFHPHCYRTGLLRIPLVDEWYELYNPVQPQEMKAIKDESPSTNSSSPKKQCQQPNATQNSKANVHENDKGVANIDREPSSQNIEQHSNFQNYLKKPYFRSGAEQIPGDVFQKSRLLFVSPIRVRRLVFGGKSLLLSFRQRLSQRENKYFYYFSAFCEMSIPIFTVLSLVQVAIESNELELVKDILSYFCIISHILYMSNNTWNKIKRTFLAFENSYLLINTIVLWISFAHMLDWTNRLSWMDFAIVCVAFVRSIIFETYNINWKRFAARMKDTLVPAYRCNPDAMPLTTLILQAIHANPDIDAIAENTLHKKPSTMNVVPIRPCVETPITSTIADKAVAFTISPLERSIYHTLLGPDRMLLYIFNILIQLSLLIMLEGDLIMHTHVRDIRLGFLSARNITVAKGAVFNLLIFSTKRLINLATNPMLSASFRQSYFLFPMTKSVIGALYDAGREERVVGKDGNGDNQENGSGLNDKEEERGCEASSMSGVCRASNEGKHVEAVE
eukprot:TRINITY_DN2508_c0_g1_i9.p1 TRINITY_DN2508_c0_g1~~TRINITY_DN2508_c0_g1_i9.p1  ORF type:complete len:817 (+),score=140.46 TRINITY_DN2508_c0_g1_i9:61-2511(+)